jgi:hypothetical protein
MKLVILALLFCFTGNLFSESGYRDAYHFLKIRRFRKPIQRKVVVVLPVSREGNLLFEQHAFDRVAKFFRNFNYLVPSQLEVKKKLGQEEIKAEDYESNLRKVARMFQATYVVLVNIHKLDHRKTLNAAGVLVAGVAVTGVTRHVFAEYIMKIFKSAELEVESYSAYEEKKDYLLGFWQSSRTMALKAQEEILGTLLERFSKKEILRPTGYLLTPLETVHTDSHGFR